MKILLICRYYILVTNTITNTKVESSKAYISYLKLSLDPVKTAAEDVIETTSIENIISYAKGRLFSWLSA